MLKPEQVEALQDYFNALTEPITSYLIQDIATRICEAADITETARYRAYIAKMMRLHIPNVKKDVAKIAKRQMADFPRLFKEVAKLVYEQDKRNNNAVVTPFKDNVQMQYLVNAAVNMASNSFTNITQTLGMIDPFGNALPLRDAYVKCCDFAFSKVATGAQSYQEAVRQATDNLLSKGLRTIDYESGVHTSVDAAVRRSVFGGMGLMVEQIENQLHDEMGCNGWEISAHEASAEDHEPIQGRQYSDEAFNKLNNSLKRRIGTLNCKHVAFPIVLGVSRPQYSENELKAMKSRNAKGIDFEGRHYTQYEATQMQRKLERAIRAQKRKVLAYENNDKLIKQHRNAQIKYHVLDAKYKEFSKAAKLRTQLQRLEVSGFNWRSA